MKSLPVFLLLAASVCALAQTPPPQPAQQAPKPGITGPDGATFPLVMNPQDAGFGPKEKVLLEVNGVKITAGQIEQLLEAYPENARVFVRGPGKQQFFDQLVRTMVLRDEGKRRKLDENPAYKSQAEYSLAAILANQTNEDIKKNIKLDDAALKKYYEDHKPEYEKVKARHILIRMAGSPVPVKAGQKDLTPDEALAKAKDLYAKIKAGGDFAALAKAESDDIGSGANGGELGMFGHGQMVPSFEEAAFKLKTGEVSEPVKSPFGYHIIQVDDRQARSFEELRPELETKARPELAKKAVDELVGKAKVIYDPELLPASKIEK